MKYAKKNNHQKRWIHSEQLSTLYLKIYFIKMVLSEVGQRPVSDLSISTPPGAPKKEKEALMKNEPKSLSSSYLRTAYKPFFAFLLARVKTSCLRCYVFVYKENLHEGFKKKNPPHKSRTRLTLLRHQKKKMIIFLPLKQGSRSKKKIRETENVF